MLLPAKNSREEIAQRKLLLVVRASRVSLAYLGLRETEAPRVIGASLDPGELRERKVCPGTQDRRVEKVSLDPQDPTDLRETADLTAWTASRVLREKRAPLATRGETARQETEDRPAPPWAANKAPPAPRDPRDPPDPREGME